MTDQTIGADIQLLVPRLPSAGVIAPYIEEIDRTHVYSNGGPLERRLCSELGAFFSDRTGSRAPAVTTVTNGTIAIELALRTYVAAAGGEVILPSYTFIASAQAVSNAGFTPVFVDVDEDTLAVTPAIVRRAIEVRGKPAAVLVVSPFGGPIRFDEWDDLETTTGVPVIFDAAAAALSISKVGRQPVCLSLHATKILGAGEGGAVISTDEALVVAIRSMTNFGFDPAGTRLSLRRGGNYRISEYAAAVGLASLTEIAHKRRTLFARFEEFRDRLAGSRIQFQEGFGSEWITATMNLILPDEAVEPVLARFSRDGIPWRRWYGDGCHTHPIFAESPCLSSLDVTKRVARRTIGVPFHEFLTDSQIERICAACTGW